MLVPQSVKCEQSKSFKYNLAGYEKKFLLINFLKKVSKLRMKPGIFRNKITETADVVGQKSHVYETRARPIRCYLNYQGL